MSRERGIEMINIAQKVEEYLQSERKSWAPAGNYASTAGYPCARKLVYDRLNWKEKALLSTRTLLIFREGNLHEGAVMKLLTEAGFNLVETQRPFEWEKIQIRGRIDARVKLNGRLIPLEIKSSNSYDFDAINCQADLLKSSKHWVRGYAAQMQLYLLMTNEPDGVLLLKNKQSGQLKEIDIHLDYEFAENIVKKLELVNEHVATKTYPERIADRSICQYCDFRHICLPDEESEQIQIADDPELLELLEQREQLKSQAKEYEQIDKKLKEHYWKQAEPGTYLVGDKFQVKLSSCSRTFYNVPGDIKEQYKDSMEYVRATVTKLK